MEKTNRYDRILLILLTLLLLAMTAAPAHAEAPRLDAKQPEGESQTTTAKNEGTQALLTMTINQVKKGEVLVILEQDDILVQVKDLLTAGLLNVSGHTNIRGDVAHVSLRSMSPLLTYKFNDEALNLEISVDTSLLPLTITSVTNPRPLNILYTTAPSIFINYAVDTVDFLDPSVFIESGVNLFGRIFLHGTLSRTSTAGITRGLTTLALDDRPNLIRTTFGDTTLSTSDLGSGATFGGIAIIKEYALDPYINRTTNLALQGFADTPSTAEIYSNGTLLTTMDLRPGRYTFDHFPLLSGQRTIRLVIRDVFGREREVSQSIYFVPTLLAQGFQEFRYGLGVTRNKFGIESFSYDKPVALAFHRIGITSSLTLGYRAEAANSLFSGGPLLSKGTPYGDFSLELAASADHSQPGMAGLFSYGFTHRDFSIGASTTITSRHYSKIDLPPNNDRPLFQLSSFASRRINDNINVNFQYARQHFRDQGDTDNMSVSSQIRLSSITSLLLSAGRLSTNPSELGKPTKKSYNIGLSVTFALGQNATLSAQSHTDLHDVFNSLSYNKHLPQKEGYGYRANVEMDSQMKKRASAAGQYQGPYGRYEITGSHTDNDDHLSVHASGAIAMVDGLIAASRPIDNSFAIVDTGELTGIKTFLNRGEIGQTDYFGHIVLPRLLPYMANDISIADYDIPPDRQIDSFTARIAPPQYGGAAVRFISRAFSAVQGRLSLQDGTTLVKITQGQVRVTVDGASIESPVSLEGDFYLEHIPEGKHNAIIQLKSGHCSATLIVPPPSKELVTDLGHIACTPLPEPTP